jgi:hypothetical protein
MDRNLLEKLAHIETRLEKIEDDVRDELSDLRVTMDGRVADNREAMAHMAHSLQRIIDQQSRHEPALTKLESVIGISMAMKWIMAMALVALGAIATTGSALDAIRAWFR